MSDLQPIIDYLEALTNEVAALKRRIVDSEGSGMPNLKFTTGSVLFAGTSGFPAQDNANLSFNDTTNVLSIDGVSFPVSVGTFTPAFAGASGGATWTYLVQAGFYTRIANRCFFNFSVGASARAGTPIGVALVTGLPFTSVATANSYNTITLDTIDAITLTSTIVQLTARIPINAAYVEFVEVLGTAPSAAALLAGTGLTATAFIRASGHYLI